MSLKLDSTINLQHLLASIVSMFLAGAMVFFTLSTKVNALEKDIEITNSQVIEIKEVTNVRIQELTNKIEDQTKILIEIRISLVNKADREDK
jgi:3'-phosphoadenosine 5'-phosphosulfate sulfotransferase